MDSYYVFRAGAIIGLVLGWSLAYLAGAWFGQKFIGWFYSEEWED